MCFPSTASHCSVSTSILAERYRSLPIILLVVLQPVKEWIHDDGVRTLEDPWTYNRRLFETLEELNIPFVTIGADLKDIDSRVAFVATFV